MEAGRWRRTGFGWCARNEIAPGIDTVECGSLQHAPCQRSRTDFASQMTCFTVARRQPWRSTAAQSSLNFG